MQLVIRGECLTEDDSTAYDRSFVRVAQKSELNCCTAVNYPTVLSLVSYAVRILPESNSFASPMTYT